MKSRAISLSLAASMLALALGATFSLQAGDAKAPASTGKKRAPAKSDSSAAADAAAASSTERRLPLRIASDSKPINRDRADRVSYAPVIQRLASSVVYVHSIASGRVQEESSTPPSTTDPRLRRFFDGLGIGPLEEESTPARPDARGGRSRPSLPDRSQPGLGSGVIITADGYILTSQHILDGVEHVKVSIGESTKRYDAKVVGRDAFSDIAVLKIGASGLTPAVFGDSDQLQAGDVVLALGNPIGGGLSVSRGLVSALSRGVGMGPVEELVQTDAAIYSGNSGGPLIDTEGRVIGINTAIMSRTGAPAGIGYAVPINHARNIAEQLVNTGRVSRGFLGVAPQDLTEELSSQFAADKGAIISEVTEDSPAQRAGLKAGDVITKVNGVEIRDSRHLLLTIGQLQPETQVTIDYVRDGEKGSASVTLGRRPEQSVAADDRGGVGGDVGVLNGVGVGDITTQIRNLLQIPARIQGAIITSIDPDSPSAKQGLREGDIILELDRRPVTDADSAVKLSEEIPGPKVLVLIWRENRTRYLAIDESRR